MTLALTEDHLALAESVRGWAGHAAPAKVVRSAVDAEDHGAALYRDTLRPGLAAQGLLGLHLPEALGGQGAGLPCTAWTQIDTVENGGWGDRAAESVVIPATMGLDKGVWYLIRQGIRGLLVHDEDRQPRAYVICEPSSHYYQIMTRGSRWMPVLIDERI